MPFVQELRKYCVKIEVVLLKPWQSYLNCLLHILSPRPLQAAYYYSNRMKGKLKVLMSDNKFDAVYAHLFRMAPYAQNLKNVTRVLDLCDAVSQHLKRTVKFKRSLLWPVYLLEWWKVNRYEKSIIKKFDKVMMISGQDKEAVVNGCAHNIEIIQNGVDYEYFQPVLSDNHRIKRIAFLGYLSTFYNLDAVLYFYYKILPIVKRQIPDVKFSVIGANCPDKLRRLEKVNGVEIVDEPYDIRPFLDRSSVFVCPLRVGSGLQNKILEAMAMGLPVVTTNIGYAGIKARNTSGIIVEDEPEEFAQRVIELLLEERLRGEFSQKARAFIETNYNWEDAVTKVESLFANGKI